MNNVLVIGAEGAMGRMFAKAFRSKGLTVETADRDTRDAALFNSLDNCELVVLSVDIENTPAAIRKIKHRLRPDQLFTDFTSVKQQIFPLISALPCAVISSHPVFGPKGGFASQNVLLMPVKPKKYLGKLKRLYESLGLNTFVIKDWKKHDEHMAYIQSLMHFMHLTFSLAMERSGMDLNLINSICSPVYKSYFSFTCRILNRDPKLYSHIITDNEAGHKVIGDYIEIARECLNSIHKKDPEALVEKFKKCRDYFGETGKYFNEVSDYLVNKISEFEEKNPQAQLPKNDE